MEPRRPRRGGVWHSTRRGRRVSLKTNPKQKTLLRVDALKAFVCPHRPRPTSGDNGNGSVDLIVLLRLMRPLFHENPIFRLHITVIVRGLPAHEARAIKWHASQVNEERADGRLQITLQLNNLVDIRTEVLRHGPDAEVIAPAALRAQLAADSARMHALYRGAAEPVAAGS